MLYCHGNIMISSRLVISFNFNEKLPKLRSETNETHLSLDQIQ